MYDEALVRFDEAVDNLRQVYLDLDHYLSRRNVVHHIIRIEAGTCTSDILKQSSIFREAHVLSSCPVSVLKEHPLANHEFIKKGYVSSIGPSSRLEIVYKGLFYFIRAYQDSLYKVLFQIEKRKRAGKYRSMTNAIDENERIYRTDDHVGALLSSLYPEYLGWFLYWRRKRNAVKLGANFSISGPEEDIGIGFNTVTEEGGIVVDCSGSESVRISNVIEALNTSAKLAGVALQCAKQKYPD